MKYFKNTELAKLYNVSEKSVRNWIEAAQNGKSDLELYEDLGKPRIANTAKNTLVLKEIAAHGKKFRNSRGLKVVRPSSKFYELYSPKQIHDIVSAIDIHREIPYQYNFFGTGVDYWDKYTRRLIEENIPSILTSTLQLIDVNMAYLDAITQGYSRVNIIDVGLGNCLPTRPLLQHLITQEKLHRYIGIDISQEMLDLAERNVKDWFGKECRFEGYTRDMVYERFDDLVVNESFDEDADRTLNLVLLFGSTLYNLREPDRALRTICDSMGVNDLLLTDEKLDSEASRRYFDFAPSTDGQTPVFRGKAMLDLLNIKDEHYTLEQIFDETKMARQSHIKLKVALQLEFELDGRRRIVDLNKGDRLLIWRVWHFDAAGTIQLFERNNFNTLQVTKSKNEEFLLLAARIKTDR